MKTRGIYRWLQVANVFVILGMATEVVSLLWYHPLSFVLFGFVSVTLIGLGIIVYLAALVFARTPEQNQP